MSNEQQGGPGRGPRPETMGSLAERDGYGVVRAEYRYSVPRGELWSALTDRERLAQWLGDFRGELRLGGTYHADLFASGAELDARVLVCERARRLVIENQEADASPQTDQITLSDLAGGTRLSIEQRGLPLELVAAYGAGLQIHLEDLAAYLRGLGRCDSRARMGELHPLYQQLPVVPESQ